VTIGRASRWLGLAFLLPAAAMVTLFYLIPAVLTFVFSFTTMGSDTGILGNRYVVTADALAALSERGLDPALLDRLGERRYVFDDEGMRALAATGLGAARVNEIYSELRGKSYRSERRVLQDLSRLSDPPRSFRERKRITDAVEQSLLNRAFGSSDEFERASLNLGIRMNETELSVVLDVINTAWRWTLGNYREMFSSQFTLRILSNTIFYLILTLAFNSGFALALALMTFYLPERPRKLFRALWLIPRLMPSVIYVLLWRWFTGEQGFLSYVLGWFGVPPQDFLLQYPWTFVVIINGFVGASMGLIIYASAMQSIPRELVLASEVDGAYPFQQVFRIILPQMRWPILFVTTYQTLSLLMSFEYILLATDGGPGFFTTEVWALHAYHSALGNYFVNRYGYGAALSVILVVIGAALSLLYLRFFDFRRLVGQPRLHG
jgi:inositol-phosphate transport system permease protein